MESDPIEDLVEAQRTAERAEAAPYIDYPPTPAWYPPAGGLWTGALVAMIGLGETHERVALVGILVLLLVQTVFVRWYSRYHGALPSPKGAPREFAGAFRGYTLGVVAIVVVTGLAWWVVGPWVAAITAAVLVAAGLARYETTYATAAERTRERLG